MDGLSRPDYVVDCTQVQSGDTIVVEDQTGTQKTVHVHGIDAPEDEQPYGTSATELARSAVEGQRVEVDVTGTDRSGHLVGRVRAGRTRLGPLLLRRGLAWHDRRRGSGTQSLLAVQREARANDRGLWAQENPIPPWKHRGANSGVGAGVWSPIERVLSLVEDLVGGDEPVARAD